MIDKVKLALAVLCIVAGVAAYYYFSETAQVLRLLMVIAGLLAGAGVAWFSEPGKRFFVFAQEAVAEGQRVAWPARKETTQTTLIVFAFVVIMAIFLAVVDTSLAWAIKLVLGRG